ncbi:hypothetical protein RND81_06G061100 [Saponaria officinalis]|uniref:Uncharacterized protein n=1 Tax=Saponaria officinalis TaxID=3572 RepID=A0AAW1K495_SAPOF
MLRLVYKTQFSALQLQKSSSQYCLGRRFQKKYSFYKNRVRGPNPGPKSNRAHAQARAQGPEPNPKTLMRSVWPWQSRKIITILSFPSITHKIIHKIWQVKGLLIASGRAINTLNRQSSGDYTPFSKISPINTSLLRFIQHIIYTFHTRKTPQKLSDSFLNPKYPSICNFIEVLSVSFRRKGKVHSNF